MPQTIDVAMAFRDADGPMQSALVACLDFMNGLAFFRGYKSHSWSSLRIRAGARILDVACGVGFDVVEMAKAHPDATFTGADRSEAFLSLARTRAAALPNARFVFGDAESLPFPDNALDGVRIDRSLQHIGDPRRAIGEMFRVARPGGRVVAVEPDWGTFFLFNGDDEVGARMAAKWRESIAHPHIGREIGGLFAGFGAAEIGCEARVLALTDVKEADVVYDLRRLTRNCVEAGVLTQAEAQAWREKAEAASLAGSFLAGLTIVEWSATAPG